MGKEQGKTQGKTQITGKLRVNSGGFGFVLNQEGDDLFIPRDHMGTALDGDTVLAERLRSIPGRNPIGRVVKVITREERVLVGVFHSRKRGGVVVPENDRMKFTLRIPEDRLAPPTGRTRAPKDGEVVAAKLTAWVKADTDPVGQVVEVLGTMKDANIDVKIVARSYGSPLEFPREVEDEAGKLQELKPRKIKKNREDLRSLPCITIDPEDARDFDDAISVRQLNSGLYELGGHIADVTSYVKEGSAIDKEAAKRGTSVYLVDHVIPMLPERLSTDLCSLMPGEDRPAFSVMMTLNSRGEVCRYRITETLIKSSQRFTYEEVEQILSGKDHRFAQTVHTIMLITQVLRRKREQAGSIDFDVSEPVLSLDEHGVPYEVRPKERLDAHRLVEECMLLANKTVACHIARHTKEPLPFIYRVHEQPPEEEMRSFLELLETLGIGYRIEGPLKPDDYRKILDIIGNLEFKSFIEKVALRSMTKAFYSTKNTGHFGLALEAYTHFTSPIRRYPDLMIHRLLKQYARGERPKDPKKLTARLEQVCEVSFHREIQAVKAEREYMRIKAMQFLSTKIGNIYEGVISGVTSFGIFVELSTYLIEGLVHISELKDDHYGFDRDAYQLVGERTGSVYRLGDPLRVKILSVSVEDQKADFLIAP